MPLMRERKDEFYTENLFQYYQKVLGVKSRRFAPRAGGRVFLLVTNALLQDRNQN
jgi:hypothetical protein